MVVYHDVSFFPVVLLLDSFGYVAIVRIWSTTLVHLLHGFDLLPSVGGNDTYGVTGIPSTVGGRGVVRRAGPRASTRIVYPGSGRKDA